MILIMIMHENYCSAIDEHNKKTLFKWGVLLFFLEGGQIVFSMLKNVKVREHLIIMALIILLQRF